MKLRSKHNGRQRAQGWCNSHWFIRFYELVKSLARAKYYSSRVHYLQSIEFVIFIN